MSVDIVGVVAFVEQGFYGDFFLVSNFTLVVHSNQFRGFSSEHTAINENKFPHELFVVLLNLPPTMELQKKSIDALLESVAILRQELQINQDSEKEIELLGELKLLAARIYIEADLGVLAINPSDIELDSDFGNAEISLDDGQDSWEGFSAEEEKVDGSEFETQQTEFEVASREELVEGSSDASSEERWEETSRVTVELTSEGILDEASNFADEKESASVEVTLDEVSTWEATLEFETQIESSGVDTEAEVEGDIVQAEESAVMQQDLFFGAFPVLGGEMGKDKGTSEFAKKADENEVVAEITNLTFELPDFELPLDSLAQYNAAEELSTEALPAQELPNQELPVEEIDTEHISVNSAVEEVKIAEASSFGADSSVKADEHGELPPPALSGMNVEAIVNQMPISRRFEFANLLFGGDIQRMGTFIHELLQAPSGSGRMDVYERWYDENNWRRRDEAAADMLRLIKRIFPS